MRKVRLLILVLLLIVIKKGILDGENTVKVEENNTNVVKRIVSYFE